MVLLVVPQGFLLNFPYITFSAMPQNISPTFLLFLASGNKEEIFIPKLTYVTPNLHSLVHLGPFKPTIYSSSISLLDFICSYSQILLIALSHLHYSPTYHRCVYFSETFII